MAKAGLLAKGLAALDELLGDEERAFPRTKIDSLDQALEFAMRTIHLASDANSGKATKLLPFPEDPSQLRIPKCPVELPAFLREKNHCEYSGYYHTDYTLPSEFFVADVERAPGAAEHSLDFTYLFDRSLENPDFVTMGAGRRIRSAGVRADLAADVSGALARATRVHPQVIEIGASARLSSALTRGWDA